MLADIIRIIAAPIIDPLEAIMASVEQLQEQVAEVKTSLQSAIERVEADVNALKDRADEGINPDDLEPISQGLAELKSNLDSLDPDPNNPPPDQPLNPNEPS